MTVPPRMRLRVRGRVQGVGFRWFVREQGRRMKLAGWVRNEPDGSVLLEAEGEGTLLDALRDAVTTGPPGARVEGVEQLAPGAEALPHPFRALR